MAVTGVERKAVIHPSPSAPGKNLHSASNTFESALDEIPYHKHSFCFTESGLSTLS